MTRQAGRFLWMTRGALACDESDGYSSLVRLPFVGHSGNFARLALLLLLTSGGCAALRHSQPEDETDVVTVTIVNNHALNVAVFNVAHGRRDRLGEVTAMASGSFKLHLRRLPANEIQLRADPIGSSQPVTSELLRVSADDLVQWTLESNLARSHIAIR